MPTEHSTYFERLRRTSLESRRVVDPPIVAEAVIIGWNCRRRNIASSLSPGRRSLSRWYAASFWINRDFMTCRLFPGYLQLQVKGRGHLQQAPNLPGFFGTPICQRRPQCRRVALLHREQYQSLPLCEVAEGAWFECPKAFRSWRAFPAAEFYLSRVSGSKNTSNRPGFRDLFFYLDYVELLRYEKVLQRGSSPLKFSSEYSKTYVSSTAPPRDVMVL